MDYEVVGLIWHTKDGQYYGEGAIVKLDHLPEKTVAYLVQTGTVKPVESKPKAARVAKKKEEE